MSSISTYQQIWYGDSAEHAKLFSDGSIRAIITDPPFGVNNLSNQAVTEDGKKWARKIHGDDSPEVAIKIFQDVMGALMPKLTDHADIYVFTSYQVLKEWLVMCDDFFGPYGFARKAVAPWEKDGPGMGDLTYPWGMGIEFILGYRRGSIPLRVKRRNATLHYSQLRPKDLIHPHEKPLPLLEDLIRSASDEGELVVDPFGGSGSLARAARRCNRSAVAIEYDAENYHLAEKALNAGVGEGLGF